MANLQYFDAAMLTTLIGGDTAGFVLTGVPFGTAVALTCWPVGQGGSALAVQNLRVAENQAIVFDVANVGPLDSEVDGINFAVSLTSQ
jgi:hypothetical protein